MITAQDAVDDLYRIDVKERKATSKARLDVLVDFCVQELTSRGLKDMEKEASIPGAGRQKQWDVAWNYGGKCLLRNLRGTVRNRIDDMIGEATNAQLHSPEIVVGYIMIFNVAEDRISAKHGPTWCQLFREHVTALSGRRPPSWTTGTEEGFVLVEVDFGTNSAVRGMSQTFDSVPRHAGPPSQDTESQRADSLIRSALRFDGV